MGNSIVQRDRWNLSRRATPRIHSFYCVVYSTSRFLIRRTATAFVWVAIWMIHSRWLQRCWLQEWWLPFYIFTVLGFLGWWEFTVYAVFRPDLREFRTDRALNILARYATATGLVPRYVLSCNPFLLLCSGGTSWFSMMSLAILFLVSMSFWSFHSFAVIPSLYSANFTVIASNFPNYLFLL